MSDVPLDQSRLPFEIRRAADRADELLELLDPPGLAAPEIVGDEVVVFHAATDREVCRVPLYRLADWDPELMRRAAAALCSKLAAEGDIARADQYIAAISHLGADLVTAPPDEDWVYLNIVGEKALAVHRCHVVPGWPPPDVTPGA